MEPDLLDRVAAICLALPEAAANSLTGQHTAFEVRGKKFAYFLIDHHGDGRIAVQFKVPREAQPMLVDSDPERYYVAPYVGHHGWTCLDLGIGDVDWDTVASHLELSYRLTAPKRLVASLPD